MILARFTWIILFGGHITLLLLYYDYTVFQLVVTLNEFYVNNNSFKLWHVWSYINIFCNNRPT